MKRLTLTVAALGLASSLAACAKQEAKTESAAPPAVAPAAAPAASSDMAAMPMPADAKMAKGTGTVTAIGAGSVTIDHAPIPEVGWPAMTMGFKASPEVAKSVKVGDKVAFDLKVQGGAGEVTAIRKQ
jgi:Cu/Ag efflux protein CusF